MLRMKLNLFIGGYIQEKLFNAPSLMYRDLNY